MVDALVDGALIGIKIGAAIGIVVLSCLVISAVINFIELFK